MCYDMALYVSTHRHQAQVFFLYYYYYIQSVLNWCIFTEILFNRLYFTGSVEDAMGTARDVRDRRKLLHEAWQLRREQDEAATLSALVFLLNYLFIVHEFIIFMLDYFSLVGNSWLYRCMEIKAFHYRLNFTRFCLF